MALPVNLEDVLSGRTVEWERLEFKAGWNPEDVLHTLCAFANDFHNLDGGYLLIGIAEKDGRPVLPPLGVSPSALDRLQKEILELGHRIVPDYHPLVEPCVVQDKHILVLRAPGGQNRPYKAPVSLSKDNRNYAYYLRRGSSTVRANPEEEAELVNLTAKVPYDDRRNVHATVDDLRPALIRTFLRDIGSNLAGQIDQMPLGELCRRMVLTDGPVEEVHPRNVALMFFNDEPGRFFPQTQIDVVLFPEGTGGNRIIERVFKGPLGQMLRDALLYLSNIVIEETVIKHPDRAEATRFFNYPYAAIEEALVNAVYHRSYEIREPIEVRVHSDHLTITSQPGPDRSISLNDLNKGRLIARRYRNRRIGEFLKDLDLTEGRGTGIPKIVRAMAQNGSPQPEFVTNEERSHFTTILPVHPQSIRQLRDQVSDQVKTNDQVSDQVSDQVKTNVKRVNPARKLRTLLRYCTSPRDRISIQAHLHLKSVPGIRQNYLNPAITSGWLEMTDPAHPNSPQQKYRTTELGRQLIQEESGGGEV